MNKQSLTESWGDAALKEATVDREAGVIRNVMIARSQSKSGRFYEPKALEGVCRCAEGINVYLNHQSPNEAEQFSGNRDVKNLAAKLVNARMQGDMVMADLEVMDVPGIKERMFEIGRLKPVGVGMSIDSPFGGYVIERGRGGQDERVKDITELNSVDVVSKAGMAQSLFESQQGDESDTSRKTKQGGIKMEEIKNADDLKRVYPALLLEHTLPIEKERDELKTKLKKSDDKLETATEKLAEIDAKAERRKGVIEACKEAKVELGAEKVEILCKAQDDPTRKALLESYIKEAETDKKLKEDGKEPPYGGGGSDSDEAYKDKLGLGKEVA